MACISKKRITPCKPLFDLSAWKGILQLTNHKALQIFHLLRQGTSILIAILLAKSSLSTTQIGAYEMLMYISYTVSFFWVSGLVQGLLTSYPQQDARSQNLYLFNAYLVFSGISLFVFLMLVVFREPALQLLTGKNQLDYLYLFLLYQLFNMPTYLVENFYLLHNQPKRIVSFALFAFLGQLTVMTVPIFLGFDFRYSFWGLVGLALAKHVWLLVFMYQEQVWQFRPALLQNWLSLSLPLMLYALVGGFNQTFDNWLVNWQYDGDERTFAIFRYGARELPLTIALANAFSAGMLPELSKDLTTGLRSMRSKSLQLMHLLFPVSVILVLTSEWFFPIVFSDAFVESVPIFNIYLLLIVSRLIFSRTVLIGLKDNTVVLGISVLELLLNIGLSFWLVQDYGLMGIAYATVLAHVFEKGLMVVYVQKRYGIRVNDYTPIGTYLGYSLLMLLTFWWVTTGNGVPYIFN